VKVYISADIEGVNGVMGETHWSSQGAAYDHSRGWMAEEVNAAVRGACAGGATEIVVKDSHGPGTNILAHQLDPRAQLISGWGPLHSMVEGIDESFGAAFLVGYHSKVGTERGVLSHTIGGTVRALRLNGEAIGETALSALYCGHYGVPVVLVTGDDELAAEAQRFLPGAVAAVVKWGLNRGSARMLPLAQGRARIEEAAAVAAARAAGIEPFRPPLPLSLELDVPSAAAAALCAFVPGVERTADCTVACSCGDAVEYVKMFRVLLNLASSA